MLGHPLRTMQAVSTEPAVCPVCGPAPSRLSFRAVDRLHGFEGEYAYHRCSGCGLLFMNPRVQPDAAMHVYPQNYAPHAGSALPSDPASLARRVLRWLRGTGIPRPVRATLGSTSRVLDVGCGAGEFLSQIQRETGCSVAGLDLSEAAAKRASEVLGTDVFCGTLADAPWAPGSFDLITAWWSLEHMPDPERALMKVHELLKPGGHALIAVPNSRSVVAKLFRGRWYHLDCPRHYHLWTPASLRRLLERTNFSHVSTMFDKSPWGLLGSLQYLVYGNNWRPESADRLRGNGFVAPLFLPLTLGFGMFRHGDTMVVCAQKT
jgi:SAM-dependent methyltransferase